MARNADERAAKGRRMVAVAALIALVLAALALAAAGYYFLIYRPAHANPGATGGQRELAALGDRMERMSEEEIERALDEIIEEGMFRISIASQIVAVEDGMAQVRIENNPQNRYLMQVSVYLDETEAEIYATGLIHPGYCIPQAEFDAHLDPGEYGATAVFTALYPDTKAVVGTAAAQVKIYVFPEGAAPSMTPEATETLRPDPAP